MQVSGSGSHIQNASQTKKKPPMKPTENQQAPIQPGLPQGSEPAKGTGLKLDTNA